MKTKLIVLLVLFLSVASTLKAQQGASGSSYINQPLADAIDRNIEKSEGKIDFLIDGRQVKSKSKVIYTGEVRKVSKRKLSFLEIWIESRGLPSQVIELLQQEARFREGGKDYWLPVRKKILDDMAGQVKKGDEIIIHTILAGGVPEGDSIVWVFVVGEFSK